MDTIELKSQNAVSIGDSGNESGAAKSAMAGHSRPSHKSGKKNTFRTLQSVTPNEAAQILQSALHYCLKAGMKVSGYNEGQALRLSIDGIHYDFERHTMIMCSETEVTPNEKQATP